METTHNNPRIFPGLLDNSLEIFNTADGLKIMSSGSVFAFKDIPMAIYQRLKEEMLKEKAVHKILKAWHPESELQQLEKFCQCRFGGLDFTPDITAHHIQHGEYWDCPLRGQCKGEGIVCKKLQYNGNALEAKEIKLLKLLTTNYTNEVIAEELQAPLGSLHKLKKELYQKLNIQTKQEATWIAVVKLNLI